MTRSQRSTIFDESEQPSKSSWSTGVTRRFASVKAYMRSDGWLVLAALAIAICLEVLARR